MPPWQRDSLPLVCCGDALAAVPGIGVDVAFQADAGRARLRRGGTGSRRNRRRGER